MHPRYKLKRKLKKRKDELQFRKQIPMLPRDSLERIVKKGKMYKNLEKKWQYIQEIG